MSGAATGMTGEPADPSVPLTGPQDCGAFFVDAIGPYSPDQLSVTWSETQRKSAPDIDQLIAEEWERRTAEAEATGTPLWNGPLCRLISYRAVAGRLELAMGPTDYRCFVGTNLHNSRLRYSHGPQLLANPVGMSAVVTSEDTYILLGQRSDQVAFHAHRIHPIAGCLDPAADRTPDPFEGIQGELRGELALRPDQIDRLVCLGLVRDKRIVQPELVFDVAIAATADQIRRMHESAPDSDEHTDLIVVRDEPGAVVGFIERQAEALTAVATASLLLHGMVRWGSGWFASTRGYLRSLI